MAHGPRSLTVRQVRVDTNNMLNLLPSVALCAFKPLRHFEKFKYLEKSKAGLYLQADPRQSTGLGLLLKIMQLVSTSIMPCNIQCKRVATAPLYFSGYLVSIHMCFCTKLTVVHSRPRTACLLL